MPKGVLLVCPPWHWQDLIARAAAARVRDLPSRPAPRLLRSSSSTSWMHSAARAAPEKETLDEADLAALSGTTEDADDDSANQTVNATE